MIMPNRSTRSAGKRRALRVAAWTLLVGALVAGGLMATGRMSAWNGLSRLFREPRGTPSVDLHADAANADERAPATAPSAPLPRRQTAPLSSAQLGAPLVHGRFVNACGAPDTMKVVVKVKVRLGHAEDVDVQTTPPDARIAACISQATRALQWDISPAAGRVTVRY